MNYTLRHNSAQAFCEGSTAEVLAVFLGRGLVVVLGDFCATAVLGVFLVLTALDFTGGVGVLVILVFLGCFDGLEALVDFGVLDRWSLEAVVGRFLCGGFVSVTVTDTFFGTFDSVLGDFCVSTSFSTVGGKSVEDIL